MLYGPIALECFQGPRKVARLLGIDAALATALVVIGLGVECWHDVQEFWIRLTWPMAAFP